jgi:hypothetical protein
VALSTPEEIRHDQIQNTPAIGQRIFAADNVRLAGLLGTSSLAVA